MNVLKVMALAIFVSPALLAINLKNSGPVKMDENNKRIKYTVSESGTYGYGYTRNQKLSVEYDKKTKAYKAEETYKDHDSQDKKKYTSAVAQHLFEALEKRAKQESAGEAEASE